ncbi:photosynthetic complex assembly protein PuhC [Cognatiyoonia sp. IB215446]|uniref:photosynthetic complex assembly protein PuhC n=1 Tax=Cognatiyoonia sp. IB215446 TaxID=3097355 RepID=UPI002A110410|nr:photosynthetic complex assembly protein PuhC [Cognatiyoonia sp. IB215446]MDX8349142.1 photosynthetic complex assembly protein PuhC [Cognatiyoonia sp. IB215446]
MPQLEQQMRHRDKEMVPRILVQAMFALMLASLGIVAYAQWFDVPNRGVLVEAPIVQSLDITFTAGEREHVYTVTNATGEVLVTSADEKAGFIGVMGRVIARERLVNNVAGNPPVQVVRRDNGNIAIIDDSTDLAVELIGYGKDNVAAFAQLLD